MALYTKLQCADGYIHTHKHTHTDMWICVCVFVVDGIQLIVQNVRWSVALVSNVSICAYVHMFIVATASKKLQIL